MFDLAKVKTMSPTTRNLMMQILENKHERFYNIVPVTLAEGNKTSDVEVLRVGTIQDRGFKITRKMLDEYVEHFKQNVYGTELQVNLEHNRGSAAAGWIKDLYIKNDALFASVEWTELGVNNIAKNLFKFVSAELANNYPHHQTGKKVDNVFIGLALTNTPALKGQNPIALSEVAKQLYNNLMLKTFLAELQKRPFVTKADKELMHTMLDQAPADEKEENKEAADAVDAKPEAPVETDEQKAAREAAEKKAADEKAAADAAAGGGNLKEKVDVKKFKEMEQEILTLREAGKRRDMVVLAETLMISDQVKTGFAGAETKSELVEFLMELSDDTRDKFVNIIKKVSTVELTTLGNTGGDTDGDDDDRAQFIAKVAGRMMSDGVKGKDGKPIDISEAQKCAAKEYDEKKGKK